MGGPPHRMGVCIVRVWFEDEAPTVRARLIATAGTTPGDEEVTVAAGVDAICEAVCEWLARFERERA